MSPGEQQPSEQALFTEAIQYTGMEQEAFLDRCCAGTPGLRARLTKLLAAHARTDQQFASPLQFAQCLSGQLHDGLDQIGSYTAVELLGEGGMGAVYRAQQQEPVQREVAIKIIHPGMDTERVIERFATELQMMAL